MLVLDELLRLAQSLLPKLWIAPLVSRRVKDPFGNIWWMITRVEDLSDEEKGRCAGEQKYLDNMAIVIKTFDEEMRSRKS